MKIKSIIFNGKYILIIFSVMLIIFILKPYIIKWILTDNVTITVEEPIEEEQSLDESSSDTDDSVIKYYPIIDKVHTEVEDSPYYFGISPKEGYSKVQVTEEVYNSYEIGNPIGAIKKNGEYVFSDGKEKKN